MVDQYQKIEIAKNGYPKDLFRVDILIYPFQFCPSAIQHKDLIRHHHYHAYIRRHEEFFRGNSMS